MLKIIMINGYKNSGKDFVSTHLQSLIKGSEIMAFAEPMKEILSTTLSLTREEFEEFKNNEEMLFTQHPDKEIANFRQIIQRFGNEAMKPYFGKDVWANLLVSKIPFDGIVIISDWRFLSEHITVAKRFDVLTVRVNDDNLTRGDHASEHELDNWGFDVVIDNTAKDEGVLKDIEALAIKINT